MPNLNSAQGPSPTTASSLPSDVQDVHRIRFEHGGPTGNGPPGQSGRFSFFGAGWQARWNLSSFCIGAMRWPLPAGEQLQIEGRARRSIFPESATAPEGLFACARGWPGVWRWKGPRWPARRSRCPDRWSCSRVRPRTGRWPPADPPSSQGAGRAIRTPWRGCWRR